MTRRPGLTLVEVLTALFIMALGTIAILTLFPLGAIQMGQAIRDSRSTESASNAEAYMRTHWKTYITEPPMPPGPLDPFFNSFTDPDGPGPTNLQPALGSVPGYPVALDPMGFYARPTPSNPGATQNWVGDIQTNVPRRNLGTVTGSQHALRLCSLMDTMGFDKDGMPNTNDRELRYNWLWIIQPPDMSNPKTANMTVVVFDRRAHLHATRGAEDVLLSTVVPATPGTGAVPGLSSVTFDSLNAETKIQPGTWIMDGTVYHPNAPLIGRPGMRHANLYRVVSVTGNTVELQTPIKMPADNLNTAYSASFIVWRGVSGVFVKSPLTPGSN